eukprot:12421812-Alexandrium_andersonii.AAC.1
MHRRSRVCTPPSEQLCSRALRYAPPRRVFLSRMSGQSAWAAYCEGLHDAAVDVGPFPRPLAFSEPCVGL